MRTPKAISTILPDRSRHWCSRDIAEVLFGQEVDLAKFAAHTPSYRLSSVIDPSKAQHPAVLSQEDDSMDVDDDPEFSASSDEILLPSHALDLLHIQVIEHFTRLLLELVGRVGGITSIKQNQVEGGANSSMHALRSPSLPKEWKKWGAPECIHYLNKKNSLPQSCHPRVEIFLALPYTCRGARRGQDWSRKDWEIALDALARTGDLWQEGYIRESLACLKPIVNDVFCRRMRPTGI